MPDNVWGQKAKFRTFRCLSAAKLRLISEKRNNSTRKYLSKANFSKKKLNPPLDSTTIY